MPKQSIENQNACRVCGATENMYKFKKGWCHPCHRKHTNELEKKRYWDNVDTSREKKRIAAQSEKQQAYRKHFKETNAKYKQWCKEYAQTPQVAIRGTLCTRIRTLLSKKHKSTIDYLGCSMEYLFKWLESQFNDSMTWENYGTHWVIDHVKPCKAYDLTIKSEVAECFHWKNLRPLEKKLNAKKSSKVLPDLIASHRILAENYECNNTDNEC